MILVALLMTLLLPSDANFVLTILHTNDIHARYDQFNEYGSSCSEEAARQGKCFGGYARLQTAVKKLRQQYPDSLLLDGGDQYQGTLWFYRYGGEVTRHFMNLVRYDAMAIGNHEFDRGIAGLVPFLESVHFSVLSANMDASQEPNITGLFNKSTVRVVGGRQVGIVGYTTVDTPLISSPGKVQFNDVVTSVGQEVQRLKNEGVKIIIAVGHAGFTVDKQVGEIDDVDIVIGGHTDTFLYTGDPPSNEKPVSDYPYVVTRGDGSRALVAQCFTWAKYLCVMHANFTNNGDIINYSGNPQLQDNSVPQDNATLTELVPWRERVANMSSEVIGRTLVKLEGDRRVCRMKECNLGNLVADSMVHQNLRHPDELRWNDVSIALVNGGGIRASIERGDITVGDVISVLPFASTVDTIELRGEHLKAALEHSVARLDPSNTEDLFGGFFQVSGLRVQYDLRKPADQRVVSVQVLCTRCDVPSFQPLNESEVYKIVVSAFIAGGGDGYSVIRDNIVNHDNLGDVDSDVLIEYLKSASPVYHGLEGRIQFVKDSDKCENNNPASSASRNVVMVPLLFLLLLLVV